MTDRTQSCERGGALRTPRRRQVFELVILGNTNKQIARALAGTERGPYRHLLTGFDINQNRHG